MDLLTPLRRVQHHGIELVEVGAGAFTMGLGSDEEAEARVLSPAPRIWWESVKPAQRVSVRSFWISSAPLTLDQLRTLSPDLAASMTKTDAIGSHVARLTRADADRVAHAVGGRLPTEIEWEYACRGGTTGLFAFGELPSDHAQLEPWMSWDGMEGPRNGFGLRTLYTGEWCADTWKLSYFDEATEQQGVNVVRGGGAYFWPWQDEEWIWCMSAARSPSTELPEGEWSCRIVVDDPTRLGVPHENLPR